MVDNWRGKKRVHAERTKAKGQRDCLGKGPKSSPVAGGVSSHQHKVCGPFLIND